MRVFNSNSWPVYLDDGRVLTGNEWTEVGDVTVPARDGLIIEETKRNNKANPVTNTEKSK